MDEHRSTDSREPARRGIFARFRRNREGATVIEFALLAVPFSLLVFAILESCISFAAQEVMANATDIVARQLRTGQIPADEADQKVKQMICNQLELIVTKNCPGLQVDLRKVETFKEATMLGFRIDGSKITLTKGTGNDEFKMDPGKASDKNMMRVFYKWPVMTDFVAKSISGMDDGTALLFSSTVWQNEPFN